MKIDKEKLRQSGWGLGILLLAAIMLQSVSGVQYYFARKGIEDQARKLAEIRLENANLLVDEGMKSVEVALKNVSVFAQQNLGNDETLMGVTRAFLGSNVSVTESSVLFVGEYTGKPLHMTGSYRNADGSIYTGKLGLDGFNYYERQWYKNAVTTGSPGWTDPYPDHTTGDLVCTYSLPLLNSSGDIAAVMYADISLAWLRSVVNDGASAYKNALSIILNRLGNLVVDNRDSAVPDDLQDLTNRMVAQEKGTQKVNYSDTSAYAFFAPIGRYGWSMAIICPESEMFADFKAIARQLLILMLAGLMLLVFIMYRAGKSQVKLHDAEASRQRMDNELNIAHGIQMGMIPKIFPPYPERDDIDVYASLTPAKEVGGDLFDFFVANEKLWFCIGDVSGKGVPASLVMAMTRSQFRTVAMHGSSPAEVMRTINDGMSEMNDSNMFVTMLILRLDLVTGEILFCNAGHNPPVLVHGREKRFVKMKPNLPVGLVSGFDYEGEKGQLYPGDAAFLYTDGLTEAENNDKELFGDDRMIDALKEDVSPKEMIGIMTDVVNAHIAGAPQSDDLTMLAIRYKGGKFYSLTIPNKVEELDKLPPFIQSLGVDESCTGALNLALEEAVSNVVLYAYDAPGSGNVDIDVLVLDDKVKAVVSDRGKPFDPTAKPDPDITLPGEERPVGGLGIFLVKKLMDEVRYENRNGKNYLTMIKKRN